MLLATAMEIQSCLEQKWTMLWIITKMTTQTVTLHQDARKILITSPQDSPIAEKLLHDAIQKSTIYKHAEDFCHGKDTHYVESFNNTLNIFQDKCICYSKSQYSMRSKLATIHWNTNVDRGYTSVWIKPTINYRGWDYRYREKLWKRFI